MKISKQWEGRIYQKWSKEKHRLLHFVEHAHDKIFQGLNVVDIGCNAGLHALEICRYAQSYLGIEARHEYYLQACKTREFIKNHECNFICANGINYIMEHQPKIDALLLSFVMYHFTDEEIGKLRETILPNIPLLVVYNRVNRPTIKNSFDFHLYDKMLAFLNSLGYKTDFVWGRKALFYSIVARRAT